MDTYESNNDSDSLKLGGVGRSVEFGGSNLSGTEARSGDEGEEEEEIELSYRKKNLSKIFKNPLGLKDTLNNTLMKTTKTNRYDTDEDYNEEDSGRY